MKLKPEMDPAAAFPDVRHEPDETELKAVLGPAETALDSLLARLRAQEPTVTTAWQFSARAGWYQVHFLGKRRLFYLVPKQNDFRVSLLLGLKAIAQVKSGPFRRRIAALLLSAKKYPEGTAFCFNRKTLDPEVLAAFLFAKIAH